MNLADMKSSASASLMDYVGRASIFGILALDAPIPS
jgi:hypothetical protein